MNLSRRTWQPTTGRAFALFILIAFLSASGSAVTLAEYRAKVDSAFVLAGTIENSIRDEEPEPNVGLLISQLRRDFPSSERIEWDGGVTETTSEWLLEKAAMLDQVKDPQQQLPVVMEIREYLASMSFKVEELNTAIASERTKDQDKQKLAEILRRIEYQKPQEKQESLFQRWLREFLEWLENIFPKTNPDVPSPSGLGSFTILFQVLLYGGLLVLLGFLAYRIVPVIFPKLKRARKPKKKKDRIILGEHIADDVTAADLLHEAEQLARAGDARRAIRKGYMALLCDLSDRKVIGLAHHKTNRDYLRDVRSRRDFHSRLKTVTETFERHWYGLQNSVEQDWTRFREDYNEAIRRI